MTSIDDMADRARSVVARMTPDVPSAVQDDQHLIYDLGFDSVRLLELTIALEQVFGLPQQNPEKLADVVRVRDVVRLVRTASRTEAESGSGERGE